VRPHRGLTLPSYKIFEFVPGAELVGTAPARSLVKATLALTTNLGRETQVEAVGLSDAKGRYRVRLPYATGGEAGGLNTAPHYRVTSDGRTVEVAINDLAVLQGTVVEGPSF
jgi:dolichyl-diphosphooligosaccharide--protein glycosyltransferase